MICEDLVIRPGVAPGAVVAIACRRGENWVFASGAAGVRSAAHPTPVDPTTLYDLASLTKPFVAATLARLVRNRILTWKTPLGDLVPETKETPSAAVTLEHLVAHRAGLEAHRPLFRPLLDGRPVDRSVMLQEAASARRPDCPGDPPESGFTSLYSDLGYLLLGQAAATALGRPLDHAVRDQVVLPKGLEIGSVRQWLEHAPERLETVAPTETVTFRGGEIVGATHDENAWAFAGDGLAGHAGLFGTAMAVASFCAGILDALAGRANHWLASNEADFLVRPRLGGTLRAGFDGKSAEGSSAGSKLGSRAFGHLGFTGTSLWCDPDSDIAAVALTNRVCPNRSHILIREVRPVLHDALCAEAECLRR